MFIHIKAIFTKCQVIDYTYYLTNKENISNIEGIQFHTEVDIMKKGFQAGPVPVILFLELIPLLMLPPNLYASTSQVWWLPMILSIFAIIALVQLVVRRATVIWPWNLLSLSQGLNVISRLMMLLPNSTIYIDGVLTVNTLYIILTLISIGLSFYFIVYNERPEVRMSLISKVS